MLVRTQPRQVTVWNVRTGAKAGFTVPNLADAFFSDTGLLTVIVTGIQPNRYVTAQRRDFSRRLIRTLPTLALHSQPWWTTVSPGGTLLMQQSRTGGVLLRRASDGHVVRTILRPSGLTSCQPRGLWGQGYVKMACFTADFGPGRMFAVSTRSGRQIPITALGAYWNAWPTTGYRSLLSGARVVGNSTVVHLVAGAPVPVIAGSPEMDALGAHGADVWVRDYGNGWVRRKDVRTGAIRYIAGAGSRVGGWVQDARLVDTVN